MIKNDAEVSWGEHTEGQHVAFEALKECLRNPPILGLARRGCTYMIETDASKYALGAVLPKSQPTGSKDRRDVVEEWVTIGYGSKTLISAEKNYSTTEREFLSVLWAVKTLRSYVEGTDFVVRSDHDSIRWIMNMNYPHGFLARWRLSLSTLDFTVTYRPGLLNQVPDALLRCTPEDREDPEIEYEIPKFSTKALAITRALAGEVQASRDKLSKEEEEEMDAYY